MISHFCQQSDWAGVGNYEFEKYHQKRQNGKEKRKKERFKT